MTHDLLLMAFMTLYGEPVSSLCVRCSAVCIEEYKSNPSSLGIGNLGCNLPFRRPNGPRNATPFPITLSSMYFMIFIVSSGRLAVTKAARGLAGRSGKSSPLSDRLLVRLAFFKLILIAQESRLQASSPILLPSSANFSWTLLIFSQKICSTRSTDFHHFFHRQTTIRFFFHCLALNESKQRNTFKKPAC